MRLEALFGPPMAAPETAAMRRLRFAFIGIALATGIAIVLIELLIGSFGRVMTGGVLVVLVALTVLSGVVFVVVKTRRDDHWILARGFDGEGEGQ